jgi:hypothetical protein
MLYYTDHECFGFYSFLVAYYVSKKRLRNLPKIFILC